MSCDTISVRKVDYYVNNPFAYIIDIREAQDYKKSHIKNAINIPYDSFIQILECGRNRLYNSDRFMREGDDIYFERIMSILRERTKTFVIYCDRGAMSMVVCNKMSRMGYVTKTVVGGFNKYNGRYKEFGKL